MQSLRTILFATDIAPHMEQAFALACALARGSDARLVILHVAQPPVVIFDESGRLLPPPTDYREVARQKLGRLRPADPAVRFEHRLGEGRVAAEILHQAHAVPADLIVMGTGGRTGLDRLIIGSVAEEVMRKAACPVLTVRTARDGPSSTQPSPRPKPAQAP